MRYRKLGMRGMGSIITENVICLMPLISANALLNNRPEKSYLADYFFSSSDT